MTTVGHAACETLEIIPAQLVVRRRLDETVACPNDDTIVSAPPPPELIPRGKLGLGLIVEAMLDTRDFKAYPWKNRRPFTNLLLR